MESPAAPATAALADRLDALLPQTQCTRCGFAGCRPYAEAMASGEAAANRCPPGGESTLLTLASMLGVDPAPLDPSCGTFTPPQVAVIDTATCIGCAKCLPACPVDAILGARKQLHVVVVAECNGCELCLAPCPVDCIRMVATGEPLLATSELARRAGHYRLRHEAHRQRRDRRESERAAALAARAERWRQEQPDVSGEQDQ